jgi:choline dehydrogenase-like flavoprotein
VHIEGIKLTKNTTDVVIIGSGMGGATTALALAPSGATITILEKGAQLLAIPENRDARAIFQKNYFGSTELWYEPSGTPFAAGNHYNHGGNSKFYGAVLSRYRERDFEGVSYPDGDAPPWPLTYRDVAPWYDKAEALFQVRGSAHEDPTEPPRSGPLPFPPVPDESAIAEVRRRLSAIGLRPFSLPLGIDVDTWLKHGQTGWDGFPDTRTGKMDAETCALQPALAFANVTLQSGASVRRLICSSDGRRVTGVEYEQGGQVKVLNTGIAILAAGAIPSAAILLASHTSGLVNRSHQVGRNLMSHNTSALIAFDRKFNNDSVYQKTFGINDFYLTGGPGDSPLGNIQLLGRVTGTILKANIPQIPERLLERLARHSVDFFVMSEDLPSEKNRIRFEHERLVLDWQRNNMTTHRGLVARLKTALRDAGFPFSVGKLFDRKSPSHQCGTIKMGNDGARSPLDCWGRAFDCENLFVTDASSFVSSAAVNPALTVAALAMRTARHIRETELHA